MNAHHTFRDGFWPSEGKALAGCVSGACVSYFCRSHAPPTLPLLTRISQIGCDSPALAAEAQLCYSLTVNAELFPRRFFPPLGELQSLMRAGILESALVSLELARCQNKVPHTLSTKHHLTAAVLYVASVAAA